MRRILLRVAALAFGLSAILCQAQTFPIPGKPIRVLVGFAAGGGTDIQARAAQPGLSAALGVPVIVENKPGASTMLAALEVARAAPDGHTILYSFGGAFTQNPHTLANVPYDPFGDFTPISLGARGPQVLVLHQSVPASNLRELVAWGRANPGKLAIASFGTGTSSHIFAELLMRQSGIDMVHVPYKGTGDAAKDLLAGRVQLMFDPATTAIPNARSGRLKMLGVAAEQRSPFLPEVPTLAEEGFRDIDLIGWLGWYGPAKLPAGIRDRLNDALVKALADPALREAYGKGAFEAVASSPAELAALTRDSYERWGRVVRQLGLRAQ